MSAFATPQWEGNAFADKTFNQLFKGKKVSTKHGKKQRLKTKTKGTLEKAKVKIQKTKFKKPQNSEFSHLKNPKLPEKPKIIRKNDKNDNKNKVKVREVIPLEPKIKKDEEQQEIMKPKHQITHQTLFCGSLKKKKKKKDSDLKTINKKKLKRLKLKNDKPKVEVPAKISKETLNYKEKLTTALQEKKLPKNRHKKKLDLNERMLDKLKSARFRFLNEQMYRSIGRDAKRYFESDPDAYEAYHQGYRHQVSKWPLNPLDFIIEKIKKLPRTHIIADFGCGEGKLSKSVNQTVHSFDLVAVDDSITACDMAHVPLEDESVDVVVFCLSLMGTNLKDYLLEAKRVLKTGGLMKVAEVESRFENVEEFIKKVQMYGFVKIGKDWSYELFCFLDFVKKATNMTQKKKLPDISLNPCLYKKR